MNRSGVNSEINSNIGTLLSHLEPEALPIPSYSDTTLYFAADDGIKYCYLLLKGHVTVNRIDDNLLLFSECAPFTFGFTMLNGDPSRIILRTSEDAVLKRLPLEIAMEVIQREALWEPLCYVLTQLSSRLFSHCTRMSQPTTYDTIRNLLLELSLESEEQRKSESVVHYIQSRCFLSRSGIMAVLSQLRRGSFIEIHRGKLISVCNLPAKF